VGRAWRRSGTSALRGAQARCSRGAGTQQAMTTVPRVAREGASMPRVARGRRATGPCVARVRAARAVLVGRRVQAPTQGVAPQGPRVQAVVPVVAADDPWSPGRIPAGKNLCCGPIGSDTVSGVSRNSKAAGERGPSRSAKGKAVSSKMTCLEMMMRLEERSRQRYPL
jgi:hypothetical protein